MFCCKQDLFVNWQIVGEPFDPIYNFQTVLTYEINLHRCLYWMMFYIVRLNKVFPL